MNFLSVFVSTFLTNYFFSWIISMLPIRNKRKVTIIVLSVLNLASIGYNLYLTVSLFVTGNFNTAIYYGGNFLASLIAYLAIMMLLLDGIKVFKTKRQRAFLNALNSNKPGIPYYAVFLILLVLGLLSLGYAIFATINYSSNLLWTLIGAYSIAIILLGLVLYLFLTNLKGQSKPSISNAKVKGGLIFILDLKNQRLVYETKNYDETTLKKLTEVYYFTEYGYLITPNTKYVVKGIKVDNIDPELKASINLELTQEEKLIAVLENYQKYQTKTIFVDADYKVTKEITK